MIVEYHFSRWMIVRPSRPILYSTHCSESPSLHGRRSIQLNSVALLPPRCILGHRSDRDNHNLKLLKGKPNNPRHAGGPGLSMKITTEC